MQTIDEQTQATMQRNYYNLLDDIRSFDVDMMNVQMVDEKGCHCIQTRAFFHELLRRIITAVETYHERMPLGLNPVIESYHMLLEAKESLVIMVAAESNDIDAQEVKIQSELMLDWCIGRASYWSLINWMEHHAPASQ